MSTRTTHTVNAEADLDAGEFAIWLAETLRSFKTASAVQVPCGDCRGCCTSSYFVQVAPTEFETLTAIPVRLLHPAPGMPESYRLLGFGPDGACPMLKENECSIYTRRPQACRAYDCRVFAAADLMAGGVERTRINARVKAWKFSYQSGESKRVHEAVKRAAKFIATRADAFPNARVPTNPGDIAILALKVHPVFLDSEASAQDAQAIARAIIECNKAFDSSIGSSVQRNPSNVEP